MMGQSRFSDTYPSKKGVNGAEPIVTGEWSVSAIPLHMTQERHDQLRIQILNLQVAGWAPAMFGRKHQQTSGCAALRGGHGVEWFSAT